jgi:hypothetical protein
MGTQPQRSRDLDSSSKSRSLPPGPVVQLRPAPAGPQPSSVYGMGRNFSYGLSGTGTWAGPDPGRVPAARGVSRRITAGHAARVLEQVTPSGAVAQVRRDLAADFLDDLRRIDTQMRETKKRLTAAVQESGTTLTEIFGVGPVIAAVAVVSARPVTLTGSPAGTASLPVTAPRRSRFPPATARFTGCPGAATGASTTPCTWPRSPRSASITATAAPTTTRKWPTARRQRSAASPQTPGQR